MARNINYIGIFNKNDELIKESYIGMEHSAVTKFSLFKFIDKDILTDTDIKEMKNLLKQKPIDEEEQVGYDEIEKIVRFSNDNRYLLNKDGNSLTIIVEIDF